MKLKNEIKKRNLKENENIEIINKVTIGFLVSIIQFIKFYFVCSFDSL